MKEFAPSCLKSLFDKDSRKSFCQPQLWTEPYNNLMARLAAQQQQQDGGVLATTAAVVQALLVTTGLTGQEDEAGSAASQPPTATPRSSSQSGGLQQSSAAAAAAVAARGAHLPGLRTSALLSLLKAAPQCVPFAVRLELFRQMMEQDKVGSDAVLGNQCLQQATTCPSQHYMCKLHSATHITGSRACDCLLLLRCTMLLHVVLQHLGQPSHILLWCNGRCCGCLVLLLCADVM